FLLLLPSLLLRAEEVVSEIKSLPGERWYGAYAAKAFNGTSIKDITFQPYGANEKKKDLRLDNRSNQAAPLLLSTKGRYVWSDEAFAFEFKNGDLLLYSDKGKLEAVSGSSTLREAYLGAMRKHFPPSGKTPDPLMFRLPQYNTWVELGTAQSQAAVLKYADGILKNGFPPGVFMVDDGWANYYGNYEFDPTSFPNPKGMMDTLHSRGFRVMLWVTPFVSADSREFKELQSVKGLVQRADGKGPALVRWWNGYSACLDLTKPAATDWMRGKLKSLQDRYGIDGFKFDAGDFDFYHNQSPVFNNENTNTTGPVQAEAYAKLGAGFSFNEFRACWKMGNQPLAQRLQDKGYSWDELKLLVPDMVSAGLIGHAFTCPDMIGGGLLSTFENIDLSTFDQGFFVRSAQVQTLMPMMQFSVAPWRVLDTMHLRICREAALLHSKMGDYIFSLAQKAATEGEPIVRHMEYAFPNEGFESSDDQYMLGEKYLVAPMTAKGTTRTVKLPKGTWIDERGMTYKGGQMVTIDVPLNRLPYFTLRK
ncbi:MAG TPA: glycoside hydrolase family 31 protein, partial [Flavisolibacter sp.]|nr:glycoside hydrolase family 31 protein [Flavisolibacter sp.]